MENNFIKATRKKDGKAALLFIAPSITGFAVFFLVPFVAGIYYSMIESSFGTKFVWLTNYVELFKSASFCRALVNTLMFTALCVPLNMIIALGIALLINQKIYLRSMFRTFLIVPLVVPVASVVLFWQIIFHSKGVLNSILNANGMATVDWMRSDTAIAVILIIYLWKNIGYNMVLFLAGLQNIPNEYYESSYVDGAGPWKRFTSITLLYLTPTTFFVFIMSVINSFKVFRETYLMAGDYPYNKIYMLQHFMNNMFMSLDYQKLTSAAFVTAIAIFALVLVLFMFERKISRTIG